MNENEMVNIDIDVTKIIKNFPINDTDCIMYIRGHSFEDGGISHTISSTGTLELIIMMLLAAMNSNSGFDQIILNAASHYINEHPEIKDQFILQL